MKSCKSLKGGLQEVAELLEVCRFEKIFLFSKGSIWVIFRTLLQMWDRRLMVSVLDSRVSGPGLSPCWGHCVVFLGKTLYSQCISPPRGNPAMDSHPIEGGVEILLLASCYWNWNKVHPDQVHGLFSVYADFTLPLYFRCGLKKSHTDSGYCTSYQPMTRCLFLFIWHIGLHYKMPYVVNFLVTILSGNSFDHLKINNKKITYRIEIIPFMWYFRLCTTGNRTRLD